MYTDPRCTCKYRMISKHIETLFIEILKVSEKEWGSLTLLYWGKLSLGLVLHVCLECRLVVTVLTIVTWVSGSNFLCQVQKKVTIM